MIDNQKFGEFIASLRKEKGWTQRELAEKLNVTDKAVSKWERGVGFPDIKTIEPLADALGVSVLEIMQSELIQEADIEKEKASDALVKTIDVAKYQQQIELRNTLILVIMVILVLMTIVVIDYTTLFGFLVFVLPIVTFIVGMVLMFNSLWRYKNHKPFKKTLILGCVFTVGLIVVAIVGWFLLLFALKAELD